MRNILTKNAPASGDLVQDYIDTAYDNVKLVADNLALILVLAQAIDDGDLDDVLQEVDINTLVKLNALVADATLIDGDTLGTAAYEAVAAFATAAQGATADSALQPGDIDTFAELDALVADAALATQAYVNSAVAGLYDHKGSYDANTNTPDLDTTPSGIKKADTYTVSVAGTFFTAVLAAGDLLIADQDDPTLESHWTIVNRNIDETAFASAAQGSLADTALQPGEAATPAQGTLADSATQPGDNLSTLTNDGNFADDQTGAEIKAAYEGELDTNAFTDAEKTKLGTVEGGATADQTDSEIATGYGNQVAAASQVEAEAGTEAAIRRFSPLRIAQAITALGGGGSGVGAPPVLKYVEANNVYTFGAITSMTAIAPSGGNAPVADELLVLIVGNDRSTAGDTFSTPAGWTKVDQHYGDAAYVCIYYKTATGSETNESITWGGGICNGYFSFYCRITGAKNSHPINAISLTTGGATSSHTVPAIDTGGQNRLALCGLSFDGGDGPTFATVSSGWTMEAQSTVTGPSSSSGCLASKEVSLKGSTETCVITSAVSDGTALFNIAINPPSDSPLTTKGDLYGFDTKDERIPVGIDGQVLTVDPAEALGIKWATPDEVPSPFPVLEYTESAYEYNFGGQTSMTAIAPTGIYAPVAGELLVLIVGNDIPASGAVFATPAGWTKLGQVGSATSDCYLTVFYKTASGGDGNETITWGGTTCNGACSFFMRISGANNANPIDVFNFVETSSSATHTIPAVTTTDDNKLALAAITFDGGDGTPFSTVSAGWIEQGDTGPGGAGSASCGAVYAKDIAIAGTTGDCVVTASVSDGGTVVQLAINPEVVSPLTTKGDLFGYSTEGARIPVGTDGQLLKADSTEAVGVKWVDPDSGGGFSAINDEIGTTYTFVAQDLVDCVVASNVAASTYSIPDSLGAVGETLNLYNKGAGTVTIDMAGTDTLDTTANDCAQYKAITILKIAATVWAVIGGSA
jgi:hypothetical protein